MIIGGNDIVGNDRDLCSRISRLVFSRIDYSVGPLHYRHLCLPSKLSCLGMGKANQE
jgi:hypothetical protein